MVLCTHKRSNWRQQRTLVHTPMRTRKNWRQQRAFPHTPTNAKKWSQVSTFPHSCRARQYRRQLSAVTHRHEKTWSRRKSVYHMQAYANILATTSFPFYNRQSESSKDLFRLRAQANIKAARIFAINTLTEKWRHQRAFNTYACVC